jgi:hypothetical protein
METIQRNFVKNLNNSGFTMKRKYKEIEKFLNKKPVTTTVFGLKEECYSFCIDTDSVRKVRNYMYATKTMDHKGHAKHDVWEEGVKIFG